MESWMEWYFVIDLTSWWLVSLTLSQWPEWREVGTGKQRWERDSHILYKQQIGSFIRFSVI